MASTESATGKRRRAAHAPGPGRAAVLPAPRGWKRAGGGYASHIAPPPTWRGTSNQVCGMWPFPLGAGIPLVGSPLGKHLLTGGTVCADPISHFEAGILNAPTLTVLGARGAWESPAR